MDATVLAPRSKTLPATLLVKYYYDYLDRQSSLRGRGGVSYLYRDVFVMPFASKNAYLQQKTNQRELWKVFDFPQLVSDINFCWKLSYLEPRAITVPNVHVSNPTPAPPRTLSTKVVIELQL